MNEAYQARQRRAHDAAVKAWESNAPTGDIVKAGTEEATRVQITDEAIQAMTGSRGPVTPHSAAWNSRRRELARALAALGFEVEDFPAPRPVHQHRASCHGTIGELLCSEDWS